MRVSGPEGPAEEWQPNQAGQDHQGWQKCRVKQKDNCWRGIVVCLIDSKTIPRVFYSLLLLSFPIR